MAFNRGRQRRGHWRQYVYIYVVAARLVTLAHRAIVSAMRTRVPQRLIALGVCASVGARGPTQKYLYAQRCRCCHSACVHYLGVK